MFETTNAEAEKVQLSVSAEVYESMVALEERLKKSGRALKLNRNKIFEEAMRKAVKDGNAELDKLEAAGHGGGRAKAQPAASATA